MSNKKTRIEFIYDVFTQQFDRALRKDKLITPDQTDEINKFVLNFEDTLDTINPLLRMRDNVMDISFVNFYIHLFSVEDLVKNTYQSTGLVKDAIFQYFLDHDPSHNKEYVSWFINLYADLCKERPQITQRNKTGERFVMPTIAREKLFFEDFGKIADAIETFDFIKKTKILTTEQRDINTYKTYHDFINTIKPYMLTDVDDDSNSVHTLSPSEIKCIQNMVNGESDAPLAELVYENEKWVIVITHDKESNGIFGKNTTWCTAGTRYSSMFDSYNKQGPLFVLIKKGFGSKKEIQDDPKVRLQFHFETNQYMDAEDRGIKISEFLGTNSDIKEFFRSYVIKAVRKKTINTNKDNTESIISLLSNLGYIDELIPILKESRAETLNLNETLLDLKVLSRIGEISSLKKLIISNCGLSEVPVGLKDLVNLKEIDLSGNKNLKEVPDFINDLVNLETLDFSNCDIQSNFDISRLKNLKLLIIDSNKKLNELPTGIENCKELLRISASCCDLVKITDVVLALPKLYMLDFHRNFNLMTVPETLTQLPALVALNLDKTSISQSANSVLKKYAISKPKMCSYVHYVEK